MEAQSGQVGRTKAADDSAVLSGRLPFWLVPLCALAVGGLTVCTFRPVDGLTTPRSNGAVRHVDLVYEATLDVPEGTHEARLWMPLPA